MASKQANGETALSVRVMQSIPSMTSVSIGAVFLGENCQKVMRKKEMIWKLLNSTLEGWDMQKR